MTKKLFLLTACLLAWTGIHAQKFTTENSQGIKMKFEIVSADKKTVKLTDVDKVEEIVIPETVDYNGTTYTVTVIGKKAITSGNGNNKTQNIVFPSTLKIIEDYAVAWCVALSSITIPEGVTEIGKGAFVLCSASSVELPNSLVRIGDYAFFGLSNANIISVPNSVKFIGERAFGTRKGNGKFIPKDWTFENLPPTISMANCERMGISQMSVTSYLAEHPRNPQSQQQIVYVQAPQQQIAQQAVALPSTPLPKAPTSDVDTDIPTTGGENSNTFAVIIANENYQEEVKVDYALNDGETFKQYCMKILGLPEKNIHIRKDATLNNMKAEILWLNQVAEAYGGEAHIIVFYAGHGIPDEKTGTSYLLPVDGKGTMLETGYSLQKFYEQLGKMPSQGVIVFMDACFSGSRRGDGMLAAARGVAIKAKPQPPLGKMVVFSAAQGDETAYPYKEKEHGLFTYYLLKKLKETRGNVSLEELGNYVTTQVKRESIVSNSKSQTPSVSTSSSIIDTWKNLKLK